MPKIVTRHTRKTECRDNGDMLSGSLLAALNAEAEGKESDNAIQARWELVEQHAAKIHRNARILAGKSKGG